MLGGGLIGFASLLVGGFSRFGVWKQIVGAVVVLVLLKLVEGGVSEPVRANPSVWPLIYLPSLIGFGVAAALLAWAGRNRSIGSKLTPRAEVAA